MFGLIKYFYHGILLIILFVVGSAIGIDSSTWLILLAAYVLWPFFNALVDSLNNRINNRPPH